MRTDISRPDPLVSLNWYLEVLKKYAVFSGRARRKEYWYFVLFNIIISFGLMIIDRVTGTYSPKAHIGLLEGIYGFAVLIPSIAVSVRRLHDTNRSGWWLLIILIQFIVLSIVIGMMVSIQTEVSYFIAILSFMLILIVTIVLLVFMVQDSQQGENQYGPNPKVTVESSRGATTEEHGTRTSNPTPVLFQGGEGNITSIASEQQAAVDEEAIYADALAELKSGTVRPGLWAKAFADSEGDENKSKALYIKLRVQQEKERRQQEQKATTVLAAESVQRKAEKFSAVLEQLNVKGYKVKKTATGWIVREPLGGRVKLSSDKSLLDYAEGIVPFTSDKNRDNSAH